MPARTEPTPSSASNIKNLTLYHRPSCGFCVRVYRALQSMNINIADVNVSKDQYGRDKLIREGGKSQVPALHIEHSNGKTEWLYESLDIIHYVKQQQG